MKEILERLGNASFVGETVTIFSSPDADKRESLDALAEAVAGSVLGGGEPVAEPAPAAATSWVCSVCGYIYEGEELPDDFVCPVCGVGPDKFELK